MMEPAEHRGHAFQADEHEMGGQDFERNRPVVIHHNGTASAEVSPSQIIGCKVSLIGSDQVVSFSLALALEADLA